MPHLARLYACFRKRNGNMQIFNKIEKNKQRGNEPRRAEGEKRREYVALAMLPAPPIVHVRLHFRPSVRVSGTKIMTVDNSVDNPCKTQFITLWISTALHTAPENVDINSVIRQFSYSYPRFFGNKSYKLIHYSRCLPILWISN